MYSTGQDVFARKEKILDKQIQDEAMRLAKNEVDKVRSKMEEQYVRKEENKNALIGDLAKMILNENKTYIGEDITEEAIKNLDKQIEGLEGMEEKENVGQEKTKTRRGRKPKAV